MFYRDVHKLLIIINYELYCVQSTKHFMPLQIGIPHKIGFIFIYLFYLFYLSWMLRMISVFFLVKEKGKNKHCPQCLS